MRQIIGAAVLLGAFGCAPSAVRIVNLAPQPDVRRTPAMAGLRLFIENTPQALHADVGRRSVDFTAVHAALRRGFAAGFGDDPGREIQTLMIQVQRFEIIQGRVPKAHQARAVGGASIVLVHGGFKPEVLGAPKSHVVRLTFRAALRAGPIAINEMVGEAYGSSFTSLNEDNGAASITRAIEDMYVQIADRFFERGMAVRGPGASTWSR